MFILTIEISSLILQVQSNLSDVPESYITDEQIYNDLKTSMAYLNIIKQEDYGSTPEEEEYLKKCIVQLSSYYSYINYTSLAERQIGSLPATSQVKATVLKEKALSFLKPISAFELLDDLSIDKSQLAIGGVGIKLTPSVNTFYDDIG